jgi:predicted nuclease with TOPRIM domain
MKQMKQTLAEIFIEQSDLAKKRNKLKKQIEEGKVVIKEIQENKATYEEFLDIFYTPKEKAKQIKRLKELDNIQQLTSLYNILASRLDTLDRLNDQIAEIVGEQEMKKHQKT